MKVTDMILEKIGEDFAFLSDDAKNFIKANLDEDDIVDFERLLQYYQLNRKTNSDDDELDSILINNLLFSVRLLQLHLE